MCAINMQHKALNALHIRTCAHAHRILFGFATHIFTHQQKKAYVEVRTDRRQSPPRYGKSAHTITKGTGDYHGRNENQGKARRR